VRADRNIKDAGVLRVGGYCVADRRRCTADEHVDLLDLDQPPRLGQSDRRLGVVVADDQLVARTSAAIRVL
jgi:hypothetical protein